MRYFSTIRLLAVVTFFFLCRAGYAQLPTDLYPLDSAVVTNPPSFSWSPNGNTDITLDISTSPTMSVIDVLNWKDNGSHYLCGDVAIFSAYLGQRLYWRVSVPAQTGPIRSFVAGGVSLDPYYNIQHMPWPYNADWQPGDTATMKLSLLNDVKNIVGGTGATADRKLGFSVSIPYLADPNAAKFIVSVKKLLTLAEQSDMAVLITLEGFEWWGGRPDLWNWWDTTKPGYNPANTKNVEWTSWSETDAVKQGWRNWGAPFQLGEPHPNLASPAVIDANRNALRLLCPAISDWYKNLPDEKKYLFAGIKLGWEVAIGTNFYYPKTGNTSPYDAYQVGYAGVKTLGLASSGTLTRTQLSAVVSNYMNQLSAEIIASGIPRRKIFTHVGALDDGNNLVFNGEASAFSDGANPGWSSYGGNVGPIIPEFQQELATWATWWAVSEWDGGNVTVMRNFENFHNNKMVNSYDFSTTTKSQYKNIINLPPQSQNRNHWMHPPLIYSGINNDTATLHWLIPSQTQAVYLQVSTSPQTNTTGIFKTPDIANMLVTNKYSQKLLNLPQGKYYWMIIADGFGRRVISDMDSLVIPSVTTGISDTKNAQEEIGVFPNPNDGIFFVAAPSKHSLTEKRSLEIYNMLGAKVFSAVVNGARIFIDISDKPQGIYTLLLKTEQDIIAKKIVVSK